MTGFRILRWVLAAALGWAVAGARAMAAPVKTAAADTVSRALLWSLVPGGGHFYLGEPAAGAAYAGTTLSCLGAGVWLDQVNRREDREGEANTLWLLGLKSWELSVFTTYRSALRAQGVDPARFGVDTAPVGRLFTAPFRVENVTDPMVVLAALLGTAVATYDAGNSPHPLRHVRHVGVLGADATRDWGTALYGADAFALSLAAGVGEEAAWRGVIQNECELALGPRWGLLLSASLFGAAHVVDIHGEFNPEGMLIGGAAGLYLGHLFQRDEHRLARPIAAHFWYNFAAMATAFALDPENNPLGVQVSFRF